MEDRRHASLLRAVLGSDHAGLSEYQGFYFKSFYTYLGGRRINRELAHWSYDKDVLVSSVSSAIWEKTRRMMPPCGSSPTGASSVTSATASWSSITSVARPARLRP